MYSESAISSLRAQQLTFSMPHFTWSYQRFHCKNTSESSHFKLLLLHIGYIVLHRGKVITFDNNQQSQVFALILTGTGKQDVISIDSLCKIFNRWRINTSMVYSRFCLHFLGFSGTRYAKDNSTRGEIQATRGAFMQGDEPPVWLFTPWWFLFVTSPYPWVSPFSTNHILEKLWISLICQV